MPQMHQLGLVPLVVEHVITYHPSFKPEDFMAGLNFGACLRQRL